MRLGTSLSSLWHGLCNVDLASGSTDKTGPKTWLETATTGPREKRKVVGRPTN